MGGCSVNTDYVKVPIYPDFIDNFPDFAQLLHYFFAYFPISCNDFEENKKFSFFRSLFQLTKIVNKSSKVRVILIVSEKFLHAEN